MGRARPERVGSEFAITRVIVILGARAAGWGKQNDEGVRSICVLGRAGRASMGPTTVWNRMSEVIRQSVAAKNLKTKINNRPYLGVTGADR